MFAEVPVGLPWRKALFSCWSLVRGLRSKQAAAFQIWIKGYEQAVGIFYVNTWSQKSNQKVTGKGRILLCCSVLSIFPPLFTSGFQNYIASTLFSPFTLKTPQVQWPGDSCAVVPKLLMGPRDKEIVVPMKGSF